VTVTVALAAALAKVVLPVVAAAVKAAPSVAVAVAKVAPSARAARALAASPVVGKEALVRAAALVEARAVPSVKVVRESAVLPAAGKVERAAPAAVALRRALGVACRRGACRHPSISVTPRVGEMARNALIAASARSAKKACVRPWYQPVLRPTATVAVSAVCAVYRLANRTRASAGRELRRAWHVAQVSSAVVAAASSPSMEASSLMVGFRYLTGA
jgi:hypothetical protein